MWWVVHVTLPGMVLLVLALAGYFAAWGWLAHRLLRTGRPWLTLFGLPAAWAALEYARSHLLSGLGWNLLAHTQWNWIELIQLAQLTGVWGVSYLLVMANTALALALQTNTDRTAKDRVQLCSAVFVLFLAVQVHGVLQLYADYYKPAIQKPETVRVALLQGNIPQRQKWDEAYAESIWKRYEQLVFAAGRDKPDLIVWPETSAPGFLEELALERRLKSIIRLSGTDTLVGIATTDSEGRPYNSAVLFKGNGQEAQRYSKIHLVPFGEFIPFKPLLGWLEEFYPVADFSPGTEFTVFKHPFPFGVLICFEDLFPELAREFVKQGAGWLLVITNDAWFERSAASLQHLQASVFRAVENKVWVGRAANTGWTGFVDPSGRRLTEPGQISRFQAGVAMAHLPAMMPGRTLYNQWGDWFPLLCLALTAFGIMKVPHGNSRSA